MSETSIKRVAHTAHGTPQQAETTRARATEIEKRQLLLCHHFIHAEYVLYLVQGLVPDRRHEEGEVNTAANVRDDLLSVDEHRFSVLLRDQVHLVDEHKHPDGERRTTSGGGGGNQFLILRGAGGGGGLRWFIAAVCACAVVAVGRRRRI